MVGHEQVGSGGEQDTQPPEAKKVARAGVDSSAGGARRRPSGQSPRCPHCGHDGPPNGPLSGPLDRTCPRCGGEPRDLSDLPRALRSKRGLPPADLARGLATLARSTGQLLHHRAFIGRLGLPIAANALAAGALSVLALLLWPGLADLFATEWPLLDGWRQDMRIAGPVRLLLATLWTLWPVWFEVVAGAAIEPLTAAAECVMGGAGMQADAPALPRAATTRLRRRAHLLSWQLLLLPAGWILVLVPYVGLPIVFLGTAAVAAFVWLDFPAERRGRTNREHLDDLRRNWPIALGFGSGLQLALLVPFVNLLLLAPAAAVAASVVYFRFDKPSPPPAVD